MSTLHPAQETGRAAWRTGFCRFSQIGTEPSSDFGFDPTFAGICQFSRETLMGQSKPFRATALVVEDDRIEREMISLLLEESHFEVIECDSAEAAEVVLRRIGRELAFVMTDVALAGAMDGVSLAYIARRYNPTLDVIVTSGNPLPRPLPKGVQYWSKPWVPLDIIRLAERASSRLAQQFSDTPGGGDVPRRRH
jgi:CheY-like chemotaxis protein